MNKNVVVVVVLLVLAAGCRSTPQAPQEPSGEAPKKPAAGQPNVPPMDPTRKVSEQDCSRAVDTGGANLMCRDVSEAERRAILAEEARLAKAKKDAADRAER